MTENNEKRISTRKAPKRKNMPVFPINIAVGFTNLDEIMIVDLIDTQSIDGDLSSFSFVLTKSRAKQLKAAIDKFLNNNRDEENDKA